MKGILVLPHISCELMLSLCAREPDGRAPWAEFRPCRKALVQRVDTVSSSAIEYVLAIPHQIEYHRDAITLVTVSSTFRYVSLIDLNAPPDPLREVLSDTLGEVIRKGSPSSFWSLAASSTPSLAVTLSGTGPPPGVLAALHLQLAPPSSAATSTD